VQHRHAQNPAMSMLDMQYVTKMWSADMQKYNLQLMLVMRIQDLFQ
jgi:hypothetical protein